MRPSPPRILLVFSDSFLQPIFQQPTDLWELRLRWNRSRTRFKAGIPRRLTQSGDDGWVIPEFAWDPTGRRLLWTQNKFPDGVRVDQACIVRQIREAFVARLAAVHQVLDIPLGIHREMRAEATKLLGDPQAYPFAGRGCGGDVPPGGVPFAQETLIGRYAD